MSFAYFDTSAVVKRYVLEPGSVPVRGLLQVELVSVVKHVVLRAGQS